MTDVIVAGGGIAGSTLAILLGRAGLRVELFERDRFPREKPCGEGLMPAGVEVLARLGLADAIGGVPLEGVRYHFGGRAAVGAFARRGGLRVTGRAQRRVVLDRVLFETAAATARVTARTDAAVESPVLEGGRVSGVVVGGETRRARLVVAADGAHSPLRRALGLDTPARRRRVGMRRHFRVAPSVALAPWVDVFLGEGHELYVSPLPHGELLVAALARVGSAPDASSAMFERWCGSQPLLVSMLRGAVPLTPLRGSSPLTVRARRGHVPGLVLLGDARGSLDPITGGGMTQALESAELLAGYVPRVIGEHEGWLGEFEHRARAMRRDIAIVTGGLLWLAEHPGTIGPTLAVLGRWPALLSHLVSVAGGTRALIGRRRPVHPTRPSAPPRVTAHVTNAHPVAGR